MGIELKRQNTANLSSSEAPDNQFSREGSSDGLLVVEYGRHLHGCRQRHHLGTCDVVLAQVKYDEVRVAIKRILYTRQTTDS